MENQDKKKLRIGIIGMCGIPQHIGHANEIHHIDIPHTPINKDISFNIPYPTEQEKHFIFGGGRQAGKSFYAKAIAEKIRQDGAIVYEAKSKDDLVVYGGSAGGRGKKFSRYTGASHVSRSLQLLDENLNQNEMKTKPPITLDIEKVPVDPEFAEVIRISDNKHFLVRNVRPNTIYSPNYRLTTEQKVFSATGRLVSKFHHQSVSAYELSHKFKFASDGE